MQEKHILYNNSSVSYRTIGNGSPVVLVHGFGEDSSVWDRITEQLSINNLLIIPDIPGSGKSEMLAINNVSISDYADCIKAILENESVPSCTFIGHSMGGYITLAFAEKYQSMLNGFGLFHSSAFADDEEKKNARRKAIEFIKTNGGYAFLKTSLPGLFSDKYKAAHADVVEEFIKRSKAFTDEALIQYYTSMINRPDRTEVLKNFPHPVLFIIGEKDVAIPFAASMKQCHMPKASEVHIFPEVGHMGMIEEPEKCCQYIISFITNLTSN
jgi:pimeloyl-ACP methyl ester carboxylesterase